MDPKSKKNPYASNYSYSPYSSLARQRSNIPKPPKPKHKLRRTIFALVVLLVVIGGIYYLIPNANSKAKQITHIIITLPHKQTTLTPVSSPSSAQLTTLASQINAIITANSSIDMSVSLVDLSNNQLEQYGDTQAFTAASTTKVITAADFLNQVEAGNQSLTENIDGNSAQYEIQQMIVVSDDTAWDNLNNTLGYGQLQSYAQSIGLDSFQSVPNTVTSNDMALLLEKLYENKLLNTSDTQLLLSYMKQANYREYIVPAVPSSDTIYHKIGLYEDFVNDEAIITNSSKAFVIVIFTNGNGVYNWPARAQIMQQITTDALAIYF